MSRRFSPALLLFVAALSISGCDRRGVVGVPDAQTRALDAAVAARLGGPETCVVVADTLTGEIRYQYGRQAICMRPLPPCSTFKIANSLIGLDDGKVTPQTVFPWDGSPQPVSAWERDADMKTAFRNSIVWWFQRLATMVGRQRYAERLKAFGYGDAVVTGRVTTFWLGSNQGGSLAISAREQVGFLHRLYAGRLPVRAESAETVKAFMHDEEGPAGVDLGGKTGTCRSSADGVRQVGWWVGHLKTADRDQVFAAVMDGEDAPPGAEVEARMRQVFSDVGYLPPQ